MNTAFKGILVVLLLSVIVTALPAQERIKPISVLARSLVLPGWGEVYMGDNRGYVFMAAEVLLWASYFYCLEESDLNETASYEYALEYAHIQPGDYDEEYFLHLQKYNSSGFESGGYNENIRRLAITLYPDDPDAQQAYIENNMYGSGEAWHWDSRQSRSYFTQLRNDVVHFNDYATTVTGVIVVNHIISGLNALLKARSHNRNLDFSMGFGRDFTPMLRGSYRF